MIRKAIGVIRRQGKFLVVRQKGKDFFTMPSIEVQLPLNQEKNLREEVARETHLKVMNAAPWQSFYEHKPGDECIEMDFYHLRVCGSAEPDGPIEEILWLDPADQTSKAIKFDPAVERYVFHRALSAIQKVFH